MDKVLFRMGLLATLRSKVTKGMLVIYCDHAPVSLERAIFHLVNHAFSFFNCTAAIGVVITASHNPVEVSYTAAVVWEGGREVAEC